MTDREPDVEFQISQGILSDEDLPFVSPLEGIEEFFEMFGDDTENDG